MQVSNKRRPHYQTAAPIHSAHQSAPSFLFRTVTQLSDNENHLQYQCAPTWPCRLRCSMRSYGPAPGSPAARMPPCRPPPISRMCDACHPHRSARAGRLRFRVRHASARFTGRSPRIRPFRLHPARLSSPASCFPTALARLSWVRSLIGRQAADGLHRVAAVGDGHRPGLCGGSWPAHAGDAPHRARTWLPERSSRYCWCISATSWPTRIARSRSGSSLPICDGTGADRPGLRRDRRVCGLAQPLSGAERAGTADR
jgi:hypothetical protein